MPSAEGALPDLVVIGAMKCGTTALHAALDEHPQIVMSRPKELNFFFGPARGDARTPWTAGNRWRGVDWYTGHFPADARLGGESSPGYTSPDHPGVAGRMAALLPAARLVYLVRDPLVRALSQYDHHRAEGSERRDLADALCDPASQYLARGRYHERLLPFLAHYPRERILVVAQEDLAAARATTLRRVCAFVGVDPALWRDAPSSEAPSRSRAVAPPRAAPDERLAEVDPRLRARLADALRDDARRLRDLSGQALASWSI